jgi:thymidylate kinase
VSGRTELARSAATEAGEIAAGRVVVLGSLPPGGRDLDLLVRRPERERLERGLTALGFARKGSTFALFDGCTAYGVELIPAEGFLPAEANEELFDAAWPLAGLPNLARPAPSHALVILAGLVWHESRHRPKRLSRLERIEAEDPHVWEHARPVAARWGELRRLDALREAVNRGPRAVTLRRLAADASHLSRRGVLISLSGIDGAGKSSHARWLAEAMTALGVPADVVWNDLLGNFSLDLVGKPVKRVLGPWRGHAEPLASYDARAQAPSPSVLRSAWSSYVTVSNSVEQRVHALRSLARGRSVIFDRGPLDLAVRMEVLYRSGLERPRRLVELAAPRPDLAFLLDIDPVVSLSRKADIWSLDQLREQARIYRTLAPRFGARVLDAGRPPAELAAEIARAAWLAVPG